MRIQVVGTSGSGKSTFADKLHVRTGLPRLVIDDLKFRANWEELDDDEFDPLLDAATNKPDWVACGNYFASSANIYDKADYIVWLKYPLWKILWRVTLRTFKNIITKEKICNGNVETFHHQFLTKNSIYVWIFRTHFKRISRFKALSQDPNSSHKWIRVENEDQAEQALIELDNKYKSIV